MALGAGCTARQSAGVSTDKSPSTPAATTPKEPESTEATTKPAGASTVPAEVKTAGFEYYGLSNLKPLKMAGMVQGAQRSGALETTLVGFDEHKATYEQRYTGTLSELSKPGANRVTADKTGVYVTSIFGQVLDKPQMELPADPKPGATWHFAGTIKGDNQESILDTGDTKIIGEQKVKIGGKEYDTLLVQDTGTVSRGGTTENVTAKRWFVKGLGAVKQELESVVNGKKTTVVLEATGG